MELQVLRARVAELEAANSNKLDTAIRRLLRGGAAFVGHDFFPAVVRDLSAVLEAEFVFVGRLSDDASSVTTIALWAEGEIQQNMTYALRGTPCAQVVGEKVCVHERNVSSDFPNDQLLVDMGVDGYVGVPLFDARGNALGIIVALFRNPVVHSDFASTTMLVFAERTAAEMQRIDQDEVQRLMESKLLQTQKLESLGVLAGGIAHDFNNLLMSMLGSADLAALELHEAHPAAEYLRFIGKTAEQAGDLCRQLLAYAGKGRFELTHVDVSTVVSELRQLLQTSASRHASLEMNLAPGLAAIRVDLSQFRQVLLNLVVNASDAIGETAGTIRISTGRMHVDAEYLANTQLQYSTGPGDYVFLEVSDTGHGMSPEIVSRIFDPFFTTKFTGRGLGLAAILGIVKGHGGSIKVYSEPGEGTSFKVLFPACEQPADTAAGPAEGAWKGHGIALVIDDDPGVRHVGSRLLQALGFETVTAEDGVAGLEAFASHADRVSVVLLDLTMPNMGGEIAFKKLRAMRADVPIILMSGFNQQDSISRFVGEGLAGFLQKPFRLADVQQKIRSALSQKVGTSAAASQRRTSTTD